MKSETSLDFLQRNLDSWSAFAGRRLGENAQEAWVREFAGVDPSILSPALELVTKRARRMPWPGDLTEAIGEVRDKRGFGHSDTEYTKFRKAVGKDPETGRMVDILVDGKNTELFKAQDCPEGRAFLSFLRTQIKNRKANKCSP